MKRAKALLPFGDEVLLQRMVRQIASHVDKVVVVAAPRQRLPALPDGVIVVRDSEAWQGPLQGFSSGLHILTPSDTLVFLSGCDAPFLNPGVIGLLHRKMGKADAVVPYVSGFYHPLAGLYRTHLKLTVEALLDRGERRFQALFDHCRVKPVGRGVLQEVDADLFSLCNINTPSAYRHALEKLAQLEE